MLSTVIPRKSTGEWTCGRLTAWLRERGLEFVEIIVKSDNESALDEFDRIVTYDDDSNERSVSRMIIENSPLGKFEEHRDHRE